MSESLTHESIVHRKKTKLHQHMLKTRRAFLYAFLFTFVMSFFILLLPIYSLQVLDRVMSSRSYETLAVLTIVMIVSFGFFALFSAIRGQVLDSVVEWLDATLAPELLKISVNKSALGMATNAGQLQRDLQHVKQFITGGMPVLLDAPWSLMFLAIITIISPFIGGIALGGGLLLLLLAYVNEVATKRGIEESQKLNAQNQTAADISSRNAIAIEAMGMLGNVLHGWHDQLAKVMRLQNTVSKRNQMIQAASKSFRMILQVGVIATGAILVLENELTIGGMIACSTLSGRALSPFDNAISIWKSLVAGRDSYKRLEREIEQNPDLRGTMSLPAPTGSIHVEKLYYSPQGVKTPIIQNLNFALPSGSALGIIGPSAAGKSTLSKLLVGVLPPSHGAVRMDGADMFKWNRADVGKYIGYMPQHVDLFDGTILQNIARMEPEIRDTDVFEAAQMAGVHEMILQLPKGYETRYHQDLHSLSPGQRQRIALARALYKKPKLVVLDEPNGNLDGDGERALFEAIQRIRHAGITLIIIAHKPSLVKFVDHILMVRAGQLEAFGPRDEVMAKYTKRPPQAQKQNSKQVPAGNQAISHEKAAIKGEKS